MNYRKIRTQLAFFLMTAASEPFIALYALLPFILCKDLGASALQISFFVTIKPVISVFSFYWSANLTRKKNKLLSNMMGAWVLARLPFLCFPFIKNVWFLIFAAAIYQLFYRAGTPAMMEILKLNVQRSQREKLVAYTYMLGFLESIFFGIFIGKVLDAHAEAWQLLFFLTSLLSIATILFQMRISFPAETDEPQPLPDMWARIIRPWKESFHLMRTRPDFAHFQWGFMIGGIGLMLIAPVQNVYFANVLSLSHEAFSIARYVWMGAGVVLSSFIWRRSISKIPLDRLTLYILAGFGIFPLILLLAKLHLFWVNVAFLMYGVAQAGSHLVWNLSGTVFAGNEESSRFTGTNVLMVGIRGVIFPAFGGILCDVLGCVATLLLGGVVCFLGVYYMHRRKVIVFTR